MKIFNVRFFGGTFIVALGLFAAVVGFFSLLPPRNNILMGIILLLIGVAAIKFGFTIVKEKLPTGPRTAIDTLRQAKMLDKDSKD